MGAQECTVDTLIALGPTAGDVSDDGATDDGSAETARVAADDPPGEVPRAAAGDPPDEHLRAGPPAFFRHGVLAVAVYGVAVSVLVWGTRAPVEGPSLVAFTVGFLLFMTTYFGAMWAGWLFF